MRARRMLAVAASVVSLGAIVRRGLDQRSEPHPLTTGLRLYADGLLKEFDALRAEIELLLQQQERTYQFMIALIAAVGASQILASNVSDVRHAIAERPYLLLCVCVITFWFPINHAALNGQIATIASYLRGVLIPKFTYLARIEATATDAGNAYLSWESESFDSELHEVLSYERFRSSAQFEQPRMYRRLAPLWVFRFVFLCIPTAVCIGSYVWLRVGYSNAGAFESPGEGLLIALTLVQVALLVLAFKFAATIRNVHVNELFATGTS